MGKQWIYHKTKPPFIIENEEFESYEKKGWRDTPAAFIHLKDDFDVDPDDDLKVQQTGEAIEGVVKSLNGALNIGDMDKDELEAYAREHFSEELDKRRRTKTLRKQVQALIDGPTIQ